MSHRMACDAGDILHTIVNFAGATYGDFSDCSNTGTPNIINVHGTNDGTIDYNGRTDIGGKTTPLPLMVLHTGPIVPGCDETSTQVGMMDLVDGDGFNETTQLQHLDCASGNRVTHWKLDGIGHSPTFD